MPAKMMKLMPLPIPFSVISSPSHIRVIEPAVRVTIWVSVVEVREVEAARQHALRVEQRQEPVRLEQGHRHGQVAGVLVDLVPAVLALALEGLERRDHARHQLHDDRGVDVRVHAQGDDREARQPAAGQQVQHAEQGVVLEVLRGAGPGRRPEPARGPGTGRRSGSRGRRAARRRMSGARKALSSESNTGRYAFVAGGRRCRRSPASSPVTRLVRGVGRRRRHRRRRRRARRAASARVGRLRPRRRQAASTTVGSGDGFGVAAAARRPAASASASAGVGRPSPSSASRRSRGLRSAR